MDSSEFLERGSENKLRPIYVLHGDEDFLKRQVLPALKTLVLGDDPDGFGLTTHAGDKATLAEVRDDLDTAPFLSQRRLVIVENADPFVTRHRASLEKYVGQPSSTGVLVLDVKSWTSTTNLAKLIDTGATIVCKAPPAYRLPDWCTAWTAARLDKRLAAPAARLLVELVGPELGLLDQELTKLAIYIGVAERIDAKDVDQLVGRSRAANAFKIFDAIGNQQPAEALAILNQCLEQGDDPVRLLGAFSVQLRRLAQAAHLTVRQGQSLGAALSQAGVPSFGIKDSEQQLRRLGRQRAARLYDWLLEVDLGLKGHSQLPPSLLLERLVVKMARPQ